MALNPAFLGRTYPPSEPYAVSREKIREFVEAIGESSPVSRDPAVARAMGHPDVVAPPTFAIVVTFGASWTLLFDPELGLDYSRVVHGEQRFEYARPLRAGDVVTAELSIVELRAAAGNDMITTRARVTTVDGEQVLDAYSLLVARGTAGGEQ